MCVISENLRRFRAARHMTQEQAAAALGVSAQTVSRWECNTTLPDVTLLPQIARLYGVTVDDLFAETSPAYEKYAHRLGSVFEASLKPEDFLRAQQEYERLLHSGSCTAKDLRLYGILWQHMMYVCIRQAAALYDRVIQAGPTEDPQTYWAVRRQKCYFLWEIGRNQETIGEYLPLVEAGSKELQEWLCLILAYTLEESYETAWNWTQKAANAFPESASLHICMGDLLRAMKRCDEAFPHWQRALELEPDWCDAAYSMGECYEELGDYGKAMEVWYRLAAALERRGFDTEAAYPRSLALKCQEKLGS